MSGQRNPWSLSDRLMRLVKRFDEQLGNAITVNEHGVIWLVEELRAALAEAKAAENEISRLKWNRLGDPDPDRVAAAMAALGSNVVALAPNRPFSDGRPDGGGRAA